MYLPSAIKALSCACFSGHGASVVPYVDMSMQIKTPSGCIAPFGGSAKPTEKALRDMGHHSNSSAISRNTGPLGGLHKPAVLSTYR